ncbi:MAG: hypothetical protein U0M96_00560, partial [Eggerthellaceae bacterium]
TQLNSFLVRPNLIPTVTSFIEQHPARRHPPLPARSAPHSDQLTRSTRTSATLQNMMFTIRLLIENPKRRIMNAEQYTHAHQYLI